MDLYGILLYNVILIEFLAMAAMAWFYNGLATRGTGKFFGPFALMAAMALLSGDLARLGTEPPHWFLLLIWTAMGVAGMRVVLHMLIQVHQSRRQSG